MNSRFFSYAVEQFIVMLASISWLYFIFLSRFKLWLFNSLVCAFNLDSNPKKIFAAGVVLGVIWKPFRSNTTCIRGGLENKLRELQIDENGLMYGEESRR